MKRMRRTIAAVLAAVLIYGVFSGAFTPSFAAVSPVTIGFVQYSGTKLDLKWTPTFGTRAIMVTYHSPDDLLHPKRIVSVSTLDKVSIDGLQADFIYDIDVTFYSSNVLDADGIPTGAPIGEGLLYYIPQISFIANALEQPYEVMDGGGRESGRNPKLELKWKIPRSWSETTHAFELANSQAIRDQMEARFLSIYGLVKDLDSLNFIINISTDLNKLDDGGNKSSILIKQQSGGGYVANVSGSGTTEPVSTYADDYIGLQLWGSGSAAPGILIDSELQPGSVYFMSNQIVYYDGTLQHSPVGAVTVGNKFGSRLTGAVPYAYTPIRFQITRDSANNVYFRVYKINQGSLELPRLYYEVQATTDPTIEGDWVVKKTLIDSYFSGEYAVTAISGVNPNNEIYYRIVVKSENPNDRLESLKMPYTLYMDTGRPPLPLGLAITNRTLDTGSVDVDNVLLPDPAQTTITVKSTDVTISWDMPLGWNEEMAKGLSYHFLLSTSQIDLVTPVQMFVDATATDADGKPVNVHAPFLNQYVPKFRLVKYVNANSDKIEKNGNRLSYTLNAFDLFTYEDVAGNGGPLDNDEHYPAFLLPNTVYYLQMYTTAENDADTPPSEDTSDRSVVISFTTLNGVELDVPLPMNFAIDSNGKVENPPPPVNYVDLTFSKVTNLDWNNYTTNYDPALYNYNIYYDIYMNTRTDTDFAKIGTTEVLDRDLGFTGANDPSSASIKVRISKFTEDTEEDNEPYEQFGASLLPNTTYYFKIKTRLVITKKSDPTVDVVTKESRDTAILPVTTIPLEVIPPDDGQRKPLAPTDFAIAVDGNGDQLVSGGSVTFTWKRQENDVVYQLIRTTQKINPNDGAGVYQSDPEYISFLQEYDQLSDGNDNSDKTGKAYFDPAPGGGWPVDPGIFTYDRVTNTCTLTINKVMFPNKLYYFSLKAVRADRTTTATYTPGAESVWISIPVTTLLIDPPSLLETVNNAELGFFWTDDSPGMTAENYGIYVKGPADPDYRLATRSQSTVIKDKDGETYYGRLLGLKPDTSYDIRVYKGGTGGTLVYESRDMQTRDGYHELEVKWVGAPVDDHSRYELAIMAEGSSQYTILSDSDLEYYYDKNGRLLPYYTEETPTTVNDNGKLYFHARIKSSQVELPGGLIVRQPLKSNTKYYIKVRTVKTDPVDAGMISYSKYIGPVNTRTEFNQGDYDDTDRGEQEEAIFLERIEALEQGYYWRVAMGSNAADRILLKGDRVVNALQNQSGDTFTVDLTVINVNINRDEVYIPVSVIRTMNSLGRSLRIKTPGAEFLLRPDTLDASENRQIQELLAKSAVEDLYLRLIMSRSDTASTDMPAAGERISRINDLEVQAMGSSMTDSEVRELVHDKLYNEDTGLVGEQLNILKNAYVGSGPKSIKVMNEYIDALIGVIEEELSDYIDSTIESLKLASATRNITDFASPVSASLLTGNREGTQIAYVLYDGATAWQKITNSVRQQGSVTINVLKTGKYMIYLIGSTVKDIPDGYWAKDYISKLTSKYDLSDVFSGVGTAFMPDNRVTGKELILLYEKVSGKTSANTGLDIRQKSTKLGLDGIINPNNVMRNVRRQETAAVLLRLFAAKKGVNAGSLKPGGNVYISDEADIDAPYYNSVLMIVDMGVMSVNSDGNFLPDANMTRAEVSVALVRLLERTGDIL